MSKVSVSIEAEIGDGRPHPKGGIRGFVRDGDGHSRGTDPWHQAALREHGWTPRRGNLSSGGPLGSQRNTRGHSTRTVREHEAPGSNPGPPTILVFEIGDFPCGWSQLHTAVSQFPADQPNRGGVTASFVGNVRSRDWESLDRQRPMPADARVRTVRHPTQNSKLDRH